MNARARRFERDLSEQTGRDRDEDRHNPSGHATTRSTDRRTNRAEGDRRISSATNDRTGTKFGVSVFMDRNLSAVQSVVTFRGSWMRKRMFLMLAVVIAFIAIVGGFKFSQIRAAMASQGSFQPPPEAVTTVVAKQEEWGT